MNRYLPGRIVLIALAIFLIPMIIIPLLYPHGFISELDGSIGVIDHASLWDELDPFSGTLYAIGDYLCHQQMNRSFIINGSEVALCIRDFSVLCGMLIGLILTDNKIKIFRHYNIRLLFISLILSSTTFFEWWIIKSYVIDSSVVRAIMGIFSGIGLAILLQHAIYYEFLFIDQNLHDD